MFARAFLISFWLNDVKFMMFRSAIFMFFSCFIVSWGFCASVSTHLGTLFFLCAFRGWEGRLRTNNDDSHRTDIIIIKICTLTPAHLGWEDKKFFHLFFSCCSFPRSQTESFRFCFFFYVTIRVRIFIFKKIQKNDIICYCCGETEESGIVGIQGRFILSRESAAQTRYQEATRKTTHNWTQHKAKAEDEKNQTFSKAKKVKKKSNRVDAQYRSRRDLPTNWLGWFSFSPLVCVRFKRN